MSNQTAYAGSPQRICGGGGSVTVAISVSNVGQGNAGVSLPCAGCWVSPRSTNTGVIKMNIEAAASATLGIELGDADTGSGPLWVPIDDVSKIYLYGATAGDDIDITYLKS
jgi:hypothetical protein